MSKMALKELCAINITDGTHKTPQYSDFGYVFLSSKNVTSEKIDWDNVMYISEELHQELHQRLAPQKDDILLAKNGTTGVAAIVDRDEVFDIYVSLALIRPDKKKVIPQYLLYAINSEYSRRYFNSHLKGVGVPNLHLMHIRETPICVPDFNIQRQVVNSLDKISDLISKRRKQLDKLDELVKARFVEMFGDQQINPHGYKQVKLSDVAIYFNGLTYKPENVANTGTVVLRSSNIQNSQLDFEDAVRVDCFIKERFMVQENDILMCSRNGSAKLVGKVALIKNLQEPMSFGAFMMIIRSKYYSYLMTYFQTNAFRQQIKTGATTTINQITGRMLDNVTILLPPIMLVGQFTNFVQQVDLSKSTIKKSLEKLELLKKALMQEYFGE